MEWKVFKAALGLVMALCLAVPATGAVAFAADEETAERGLIAHRIALPSGTALETALVSAADSDDQADDRARSLATVRDNRTGKPYGTIEIAAGDAEFALTGLDPLPEGMTTGDFLDSFDEPIADASGMLVRNAHTEGLYVDSEGRWIYDSDLYLYVAPRYKQATVKYDSNRPLAATADVVGAVGDQTIVYGEDAVAADCGFVLSGWEFTGWNTAADGSGTAYAAGASLSDLVFDEGDVIAFYAQWISTADLQYSFSSDSYSWTKLSSAPLDFTVNRNANDNLTYGLFTGVKVDGELIDASNYTAASGSLKLSLDARYLEKLRIGDHKITVTFRDGDAEAMFTVKAASSSAGAASRASTPRTGDANSLMTMGALLLAAAFGLALAMVAWRRYTK